MKNAILIFLILVVPGKIFSQISMVDSTVQIIGYWDIGEKQSFNISKEKYKVNGTDTTSRLLFTYEADVTIKDSTAKSYTIEWLYKNYKMNTENEFLKRLGSIG